MLTFFTTAKPFRGHINIIQRNALKSWTLLHPAVEVILFGDDEGSAEVARDLGIRHEPRVQRTEFGAVRLDSIFGKAQTLARHDILCYVNCDIILLSDFLKAAERVRAKYARSLMVGRRWDTPITEPVDFSDPDWSGRVRSFALSTNNQRDEWWIDYFAFSRGLYVGDIPPLAIGRRAWDNWLVWRGLNSKEAVVDASGVVVAVHQNHDYNHHPQGTQGVWEGDEAKRNFQLAGGWAHLRTISDATHEFAPSGRIRSTWLPKRRAEIQKSAKALPTTILYSLLDLTYTPRHAIGLSRNGIAQLKAKLGTRRNPQ
jgi:hypothetical protein